jgi:hypothetical protein
MAASLWPGAADFRYFLQVWRGSHFRSVNDHKLRVHCPGMSGIWPGMSSRRSSRNPKIDAAWVMTN